MSKLVAPLVAILAGIGAFASVMLLKPAVTPPSVPSAVAAAPVAPPPSVPAKPTPPPPPPTAATPSPRVVPKPVRPVVVASWRTGNANGDKATLPSDPYELAFDATEGRVMARTRDSIQVHDLKSGRLLHSMKADPTMAFLSHLGNRVAVVREHGAGIDVYDGSLARLGGWTAPKSNYHSFGRSRFSPAGKILVAVDNALEAVPNQPAGYPVATVLSYEGRRWPTRIARPESGSYSFGHAIPVPKHSCAILANLEAPKVGQTGRINVASIDPSTGKLTPIKAIEYLPGFSAIYSSLELSGDSRVLMASSLGHVEVADWRADKRLLRLISDQTTFFCTALAADARHVLVIRAFKKFLVIEGARAYDFQRPTELQLYALASSGDEPLEPVAVCKLEDLSLPNWANALAVSRDGKLLGIASGSEVRIVDFEAAFGVKPGSPALPADDEESRFDP